jgi:hypothetical protein
MICRKFLKFLRVQYIGTGKGEFIKTDIGGHFSRSFLGSFTIAIVGTTYRQVNNYEFPDGSRLQLNFEGEFENGIRNYLGQKREYSHHQ